MEAVLCFFLVFVWLSLGPFLTFFVEGRERDLRPPNRGRRVQLVAQRLPSGRSAGSLMRRPHAIYNHRTFPAWHNITPL